MKNLDIIIPTHNELDSLDELISRIEKLALSVKKERGIKIGLIIVDDSSDDTITHLENYAKDCTLRS